MMNQINVNKNEICHPNIPFSNNFNSFSHPGHFYSPEDLIHEESPDDFLKESNLNPKFPDLLKHTNDDLAYESKAPLLNIMLASELFEQGSLSTEQKMYVDIIQRNSKRISDVIAELNPAS